ncbi:hypothetical protein [Stenoxybacter acetivorans]|uniref:hypothetical protein n=1 Tax=Stenoxybacter acetivorans TaxID=422441 RepID=UPI0005669C08|nr:hypothetical protein [Stenoxybacter acetivorans]
MAADKNTSFDWFRSEIASIKSKRFHIFDKMSGSDLFYEKDGRRISIAGDYADFIAEFGWAKLFTDCHDAPKMMVYPLKEYRCHVCKDGNTYIGFGDRGCQHVCFEENSIINGCPHKVYVVSANDEVIEVFPGFSEWLISAYNWTKSKYSQKRWERIINGPKPFSQKDQRIVDARRLFKWKLIGFAEDGDALFEIENCSEISLPYLSIGVSDIKKKILTGGVWLDVRNVKPGNKAIVRSDCYKDCIPSNQLDVFALPDPIPEKKEAYWEFEQ